MSVMPETAKPGAIPLNDRMASACFYLAALVALTGALGVLLGSVPDIGDRLGVDPDAYWNERLAAALLLGAVGLFFGVLVNLVGAYLASSRDQGKRLAGRIVLIVSILPHLVSIVSLLVYTPEDWTHTITHIITVVLIAVGLAILRSTPSNAQLR